MNQTVLTLLGALALYGLAALVLPQPGAEAPEEATEVAAETTEAETASPAAGENADLA